MCENMGTSRYQLREWVPSSLNHQSHLHVPVAQSVSAQYLYCSTCEKCRGCEFEPHLEQWFWSKQFHLLTSPTNYCANDPAAYSFQIKLYHVEKGFWSLIEVREMSF